MSRMHTGRLGRDILSGKVHAWAREATELGEEFDGRQLEHHFPDPYGNKHILTAYMVRTTIKYAHVSLLSFANSIMHS